MLCDAGLFILFIQSTNTCEARHMSVILLMIRVIASNDPEFFSYWRVYSGGGADA